MNTPTDQPWSQDDVDPMIQMTNELEDLSNIFNIDSFDLDALPDIDADFGGQLQQPQPGKSSNTPFDESLGGLSAPPRTIAQDFGEHNGFGMPAAMRGGQQQFLPHSGSASGNIQFGTDSMFQPSMPQQFQTQQFQFPAQQPFFPGNHVPPTPTSFELHGESGRFVQQQADAQQRAMIEQQYQLRKNERVQFTPMASPSGTPQFHVPPEFTVPGAYFSPLTSPALHAQNSSSMHQQYSQQQQQQQQGYYTNSSTAPSSAAPSPLDPNVDVEMGGDGMTLPEPATLQRKSTRKKAATPRSMAMSKVKQSPIQKAQKRKPGLLSSVPTSKDAAVTLQNSQQSGKSGPHSAPLPVRVSESSENDSVSPEALNEALMGPPPKPGSSLSQSPALTGQHQGNNAVSGTAATPNSLLSTKCTQQPANGSAATPTSLQHSGQMSLDDFQLPEAAEDQDSRRSSLAQLKSQILPAPSAEQTPRLSARKTPKLGPLSTPSSARPPSATASPSVAMSPMTASTPAALLKDKNQDKSGRRGSKKRGSVSASASTLASPAIRPRISPSIKPLLPEGTTLSSPNHALLLASKSNYQNLLEGNRLPGVNYPDSLSTGLTSKRTSHKVAEQGRRNRINDALKEMQALIPSKSGADGDAAGEEDSPEVLDADGKETKESIAKSNSSKAATVESANKYLRILKENDIAQKATILALKKENEVMRRKLEEKLGSSTASAAGSGESQSPPQPMDESMSPLPVSKEASELGV